MSVKQYNLGSGVGKYFVLMQSSASYLTPVNFFMLAANLWIAARSQIISYVGWLNFPIFILATLFGLLVIVPTFHHFFMMKSVMTYMNQQSWNHNNPGADYLKRIEEKLDKINRGEKW